MKKIESRAREQGVGSPGWGPGRLLWTLRLERNRCHAAARETLTPGLCFHFLLSAIYPKDPVF